MNILIDCDDVLLDWQRGFRSWLRDIHNISAHPSGPTSWDMSDWLGLSSNDCFSLVTQFNSSKDFGFLPALPTAVEVVRTLKQKGHSLYVITSCGIDPQTIQSRSDNLISHFGDVFDEVIAVPLGVGKQVHLQSFERSIWVEDNYKNALSGLQCGHQTYMMRRNHNRNDESTSHDQIAWVDDWHDLSDLISRLA